MDERQHLYTETITRLERQIEGLERNRRTLKWYLVGGLVLAVGASLLHWIAALAAILLGATVYLVGHYISMVHIAEDKSAIADAKAVLSALEGGDARPPTVPPPAAPSAGPPPAGPSPTA